MDWIANDGRCNCQFSSEIIKTGCMIRIRSAADFIGFSHDFCSNVEKKTIYRLAVRVWTGQQVGPIALDSEHRSNNVFSHACEVGKQMHTHA